MVHCVELSSEHSELGQSGNLSIVHSLTSISVVTLTALNRVVNSRLVLLGND